MNAFLMDESHDITESFTSKFELLVSYAAYDATFAHYLLSMEREERAYTWDTTEDLLDAVRTAYAGDQG